MFLYAYLVLDDIATIRSHCNEATEFPAGLIGYYKLWFHRKFPNLESCQRDLHRLVSVIVHQKSAVASPQRPLRFASGLRR